MARMLIVPSRTLSPLSTAVPLPTDGQPEWWRCGRCDRRQGPGDDPASHDDLYEPCPSGVGHDPFTDGPFPFTVAVWQEGPQELGDGFGTRWWAGAVVATVEVTGKGHHAYWTDEPDAPEWELCCPDAPPYGWHTPTSTVVRLDVPIPMERPTAADEHRKHPRIQDPCGSKCRTPAPWWWADLEVPA